jgi:hypothetical protein
MISIAAVEELTYSQSRLCRLLGNPVAFGVVSLLANGRESYRPERAAHQQYSGRLEGLPRWSGMRPTGDMHDIDRSIRVKDGEFSRRFAVL